MQQLITQVHSDGSITIQKKQYIEDGWFIEVKGAVYKVMEIPQYGGQAQEVGTWSTLFNALKQANSLV